MLPIIFSMSARARSESVPHESGSGTRYHLPEQIGHNVSSMNGLLHASGLALEIGRSGLNV